ncbi:peptidase M50 [Devosia sp. Root105]|uniref:peptidase M50 n=1 Tax=Devosia sp. Root105 TaxID=1736423 RepID=UPI0006FBF43F|nr:peptidase M50 [Devosia sp. Root105]KQV09065.1 peptidase M50 [Devosia sp. Root105]
MAQSLFSSSWYRVSGLQPRLRGQARIHRQRFRRRIWYVLEDQQNGKFHRLSSAANLAVALMDGRRSMEQIWDMVGQKAGDDPPTQDEMILLLSQLHAADLLQTELPPDFTELAERSAKTARSNVMSRLKNPLALRMPLWDPDRFLEATAWLVRPIFTVYGLLAWIALVISGLVVVALNWGALQAAAGGQLMSAGNLAMIALAYPVVKALHEAGHAYAAKVFGGHVHEFGLMLLILVPAPYVDATAATAFASKWQRIVVSGAGIMVEFGLAALAAIFWASAEPGLAREIAFSVMLIGGVSTLLFNGNPLLRFDGYYVFMDWLEIPNLATRANRYVGYLVQRYAFGLTQTENPSHEPSERVWLFFYAILAFIYRIVLSLGIALLIATQLFFIGVLLAILTLSTTFVIPAAKMLGYLFSSPALHNKRRRALTVSGAALALCVILVGLLPLPYATVAQGVVWLPGEDEVRAGTAGIVTEFMAADGASVAAGAPLLQLEDAGIAARRAVIDARLAELSLRYEALQFTDRVQAAETLQQRDHVEAQRRDLDTREAALLVAARAGGRFIAVGPNLVGRYVRQGELLGYVVSSEDPIIRVVIPQSEVDLVRARTDGVEVRYSFDPGTALPGSVTREVPTGQNDLPSLALAARAGGDIAVTHSADGTPVALERLFVIDVTTKRPEGLLAYGARAYVRFDHGAEPVYQRLQRAVRQTLLRVFGA